MSELLTAPTPSGLTVEVQSAPSPVPKTAPSLRRRYDGESGDHHSESGRAAREHLRGADPGQFLLESVRLEVEFALLRRETGEGERVLGDRERERDLRGADRERSPSATSA